VDEPGTERSLLQRVLRVCQRLLWVAMVAYTAALLGWMIWLEYAGDGWWCTWIFLYVPGVLFLLPLGVLVPLALLLDWRAIWPAVGCTLCVFLFYEDFELQFSRSPREGHTTLRVLSNNIGQHGEHPLTPYLEAQDPDLILLQEATSRGPAYVKQYGAKGLNTVHNGEFVCSSKYPITSSELLTDIRCLGHPVATRYTLDVEGRQIIVYNVHIASPRRLLGKLRGRGAIAQLGYDLGLSMGRDYGAAETVAKRLEAARALAERIGQETEPVVVAGDFNIPARGRGYHLFADELSDAFEERGRGYGFTFPGRTRNPLSLFGPWLRLDMVFASNDWRVLESKVEPRRPSQHRAVVAELELRKD
jgi:endonuclease/exonuclease/phosphatase (EEP) superfamily protein YafD